MSTLAPTHRSVLGALGRRAATSTAVVRGLRRHPLVLFGLLILAMAPVLWQVVARAEAPSPAPAPADLFMQSVATRDGALGWNQLCSTVQAQVPLALILEQTGAQRVADAGQGVTLTVDHVGDRPRPNGGQIRFYVAAAQRADGWVGQKTYVVKTQASGCVESVE